MVPKAGNTAEASSRGPRKTTTAIIGAKASGEARAESGKRAAKQE